ncbi:MAG: 50S ribosomal protein L5 [Patescibacteria group bacterium]
MNKLQKKYQTELRPKLKADLGLDNIMAVPKVRKVVVNIGAGQASQDKKYIELAESILTRLTGQKPILTKAKKSISNFKIREGMLIGAKVTLRGARMYDFLEKLVNATIPRLRDFYGLDRKQGFDGRGNYMMGFKEHIVFPEIGMEDVDKIHGLEIAINTSAKNDEQTLALLSSLGFPFKKTKK